MEKVAKTARKRRSDRNHIIYIITNIVSGEKYVGLAACVDRLGKETLRARWCRHVGRAMKQNKDWKLCESIRTFGPEVFIPEILMLVRGRREAFEQETVLRKSGEFSLNTK